MPFELIHEHCTAEKLAAVFTTIEDEANGTSLIDRLATTFYLCLTFVLSLSPNVVKLKAFFQLINYGD